MKETDTVETRAAVGGSRLKRLVGPRRIQRRRTKGWRMPPNTVSVCRPGKFGNPFAVTDERTQAEAVAAFRTWLTVDGCTAGLPERKQQILESLHELRGKNLACFCKEGTPCHADVLLELANERPNGPLEPTAGNEGTGD